MNHTLDASAILRYLDNEAGADQVKKLFLDAYHQRTELYVNAVNWSEVIYTCIKRAGAAAKPKIQQLSASPITLISVDDNMAWVAADMRLNFNLHLADAFALATAATTHSTLVTADYDFKQSSVQHPISYLPKK